MRILDTITSFLFNKVTDTVFWRIVPWKWSRFKQIVIGKGITDINPTALLGIDLEHVILENEGKRGDGLVITGDGLYNHLTKELLIGRDQEKVILEEGIEEILPFAFAFHQNIKEVRCPSTLKIIHVSAFEGCKNLKNVYGIPEDAKIHSPRAFKGISGVNIVRDTYPAKGSYHRISRYGRANKHRGETENTIYTNHAKATLRDGEVTFFELDEKNNIDFTPFYGYSDLIDMQGGEDFFVALRANGEVIYEDAHPFYGVCDYYCKPFRSMYQTPRRRLEDWKNIVKIKVAGEDVVGLSEEGYVFCTRAEDETRPIQTDCKPIYTREDKIFITKSDGTDIIL